MPDWSKEIASYLDSLNLDPPREAEIIDELNQHLNDRYNELLSEGVAPEQARTTVRAELSGGELAAALRPVLRTNPHAYPPGQNEPSSNFFVGLWKDLRHGARLLRLNPGFATIAILSLTLGIGANSAIFQLLDSVRLRTLPVHDPQSLADVRIVHNPFGRSGSFRSHNPQLTNAIWEQLRDHQQAFSSIAAWSEERLNLAHGGEARYARGLMVSGSFFDLLQVHPQQGRLLSSADDYPGCGSSSAVISHAFWQREFGGRPLASDAKISLEGHPFQIVGITPPSFFGVEVGRAFDVAIPVCAEPIVNGPSSMLQDRRMWFLAAIGRLKPGWTLDRASAQFSAISPGIFQAALPPNYSDTNRQHFLSFKLGALSASCGVSSLRREYETPLYLLMGISGLVLLIACFNLANLMLARASARRREMAVRLALGASRVRLARQMLAESLLIATGGAVCGVVLAQLLSRFMVSFLSTGQTPIFVDLAPDWLFLAFTVTLAVITCILFGLAPALQAAHTAPNEAMKAGGRGQTASRERFGLRRSLVVCQVGISLVLLVGALLFVRTFRNLLTVDPGFQQDNILVTDIDLSPVNLPPAMRTQYKHDLLQHIRAVPGVAAAADVHNVPLSGSFWNEEVTVPRTNIQRKVTNFNQVTPGYFDTMHTRILSGRDFNDQDTATTTPKAIVTEAFARRYLNGADPVGRTFDLVQESDEPVRTYEIIGMVQNSKYVDLRENFDPIVYTAEAQSTEPDPGQAVVIRSDGDITSLIPSIRAAIGQVDPSLVIQFQIFKTSIREGLIRERLMATLSGFFGILAAVLAMMGLYGVISYMVIRRRTELGIRIALGANRSQILGLIMREAATLLGIGLLVGLVPAILLGGTARSLLFELRPTDALTLALAAATLAAPAILASFIPAQRAAHADPMRALREE